MHLLNKRDDDNVFRTTSGGSGSSGSSSGSRSGRDGGDDGRRVVTSAPAPVVVAQPQVVVSNSPPQQIPAPAQIPSGPPGSTSKAETPVNIPINPAPSANPPANPPENGNGGQTGATNSPDSSAGIPPAKTEPTTGNPQPTATSVTDAQNTNTSMIPGPVVISTGSDQGQTGAVESADSSASAAPNYGAPIGIAAVFLLFFFVFTRRRQQKRMAAKERYVDTFAKPVPEGKGWFGKKPFKAFGRLSTSFFLQTPSPIGTTSFQTGSQPGSGADHSPLRYAEPVVEVSAPAAVLQDSRMALIKEQAFVEAPPSPNDSKRESVRWFGNSSKLLRSIYSTTSDRRLTDNMSLNSSLRDRRMSDGSYVVNEKRLTYMSGFSFMKDKNKSFLSDNSSISSRN